MCLRIAIPVLAAVAFAGLPAIADQPAGRHVLVVFQGDSPASRELAEHYAARREVPAGNLLGLPLLVDGKSIAKWDYKTTFERIIRPVGQKLAEPAPGGGTLAEQIAYIVTLPGLPTTFEFGFVEKASKVWPRKTARRSVDQFLVSVHENVRAGVDEELNAPGRGATGPLGSDMSELALPLYGQYHRINQAKSFAQLRKDNPRRFNFYLVTRLGLDVPAGRQMLDNALYAERYLRLAGPDEAGAFRPHIWLDQKPKFAADHVTAMHRAVAIVQGQGLPDNPFAAGVGLRRVWPLVIDYHDHEIGMIPKDSSEQHRPTVTVKIVEVNQGAATLTVDDSTRQPGHIPMVLYCAVGAEVSNGRATARVNGIELARNVLRVSSTAGFASGQEVRVTWPGRFPADDCFMFYGFYGLGQYEDVFKFPPGAIGVHVDSSCMVWARMAMQRNIAATFGVTSEPLSIGIPHGDQMLLALAGGYNWAEAVYGSLRLAQRWAGVAFGDPLYAPFNSLQLVDKTAPVLGTVAARPMPDGAVVTAELAGTSDDEIADVAMFKIEFGPTSDYGRAIEFYDWPEPEKSKGVAGRRFGYSRQFTHRLAGLEKGRTYHYRVIARDPAGNETASDDKTFRVP